MDLDEFFVDWIVIIDIFGVYPVLSDIFNPFNKIGELIFDSSLLRFIFFLILLLFLLRLAWSLDCFCRNCVSAFFFWLYRLSRRSLRSLFFLFRELNLFFDIFSFAYIDLLKLIIVNCVFLGRFVRIRFDLCLSAQLWWWINLWRCLDRCLLQMFGRENLLYLIIVEWNKLRRILSLLLCSLNSFFISLAAWDVI